MFRAGVTSLLAVGARRLPQRATVAFLNDEICPEADLPARSENCGVGWIAGLRDRCGCRGADSGRSYLTTRPERERLIHLNVSARAALTLLGIMEL
jgi:hypothetical protein